MNRRVFSLLATREQVAIMKEKIEEARKKKPVIDRTEDKAKLEGMEEVAQVA